MTRAAGAAGTGGAGGPTATAHGRPGAARAARDPAGATGHRGLSHRGLSRRGLLALPLAGLGLSGTAALSGCAAEVAAAGLWHQGQLAVATGNNTGVYYQVGAGYADVITRRLAGYEAVAAPTTGSIENIQRVNDRDVEIGIGLIDMCADAINGVEPFTSRLSFRALAQMYSNYMQVVVRTDRGIRSLADLRGRRVSTGSPGSGSELMAVRMLRAVGINPDTDCLRVRSSLQQGTTGMIRGEIDAVFWTGGLPTLGITNLYSSLPGKVGMLPLDGVIDPLKRRYSNVYQLGVLRRSVYGDRADTNTLVVPNVLFVTSDMPDDLAHDLTALIFDYTKELATAHPEWKNVNRQIAPQTDPVELHPGARRYYNRRS